MKRSYEKEAIEYVKLYEKSKGRKVWKPKKKIGCDLISSAGFHIEVKSWNKPTRPNSIEVYETIFRYLENKKWGERAFYIYIVYDIENDPKLLRITPNMQEWYKHKIRILKKKSIMKAKDISLRKFKRKVIS